MINEAGQLVRGACVLVCSILVVWYFANTSSQVCNMTWQSHKVESRVVLSLLSGGSVVQPITTMYLFMHLILFDSLFQL